MMKLFLSLTFAAVANASVLQLTPENFAEKTDGKRLFLKFFAPWCMKNVHCKSMAPAWEQLTAEYRDSATALVAEVDCSAERQTLCEEHGVDGFPTLMYGDPFALEVYRGGRDYDSLANFARDNLNPVCSPNNIDLCDDAKKVEIKALMDLPAEKLTEKISALESKLEEVETHFNNEEQKLWDKSDKLQEDHEAKVAAVKAAGLSLMKSVQAAAKKLAGKDKL